MPLSWPVPPFPRPTLSPCLAMALSPPLALFLLLVLVVRVACHSLSQLLGLVATGLVALDSAEVWAVDL